MSKNTGKTKPLSFTQEALKELLDYDQTTGIFKWKVRYNNRQAGYVTPEGYVCIIIHGRNFKSHRLAWFWMYGEDVQSPFTINHINFKTGDNRLINLEKTNDREQNRWQRIGSRNKSGHKGISYHKSSKMYRARIETRDPITKKKTASFEIYGKTIEELIEPLREARERIHGKYAHHG